MRSSAIARFTFLFWILFVGEVIQANCIVAIPDDCPEGQVCAKYNKEGDSKCFQIPEAPKLIFDLPFSLSKKVVCAQSGRFSSATHIYRNMLYAIDLASPYDDKPGNIFASESGKAFVFDKCKNPAGKPAQTKVDDCGAGYGNHVRILHDEGYISLYAHLSAILVKDGQQVRKNEVLGVEGATGFAAYRHLHWDIHKLEGAKIFWESSLKQPGWGGYSVPFRFRVIINGVEKIINSSQIACRWLDMTQAPWSGTFKTDVEQKLKMDLKGF